MRKKRKAIALLISWLLILAVPFQVPAGEKDPADVEAAVNQEEAYEDGEKDPSHAEAQVEEEEQSGSQAGEKGFPDAGDLPEEEVADEADIREGEENLTDTGELPEEEETGGADIREEENLTDTGELPEEEETGEADIREGEENPADTGEQLEEEGMPEADFREGEVSDASGTEGKEKEGKEETPESSGQEKEGLDAGLANQTEYYAEPEEETISEARTNAVTPTTAAAKKYMDDNMGKQISSSRGNQCVELFNQYLEKVFGRTPPSLWNAYEIYDKTYSGWEKIPAASIKDYRVGDIVVYGPGNGTDVGAAGHVALVYSVSSGKALKLFEQNWAGNPRAALYDFHSARLKGIIRPAFSDASAEIHGSALSQGFDRTIPDGDYLIASAASAGTSAYYYLDIAGEAVPAANDTNVQLWGPVADNPPAWDIWTVTYNSSDKFYTIRQKGTNMCLDVYCARTLQGTNVQVYTNNGASAQKWAIEWNGSNGYRLRPQCSGGGSNGMCLDIQNGTLAAGTQVRQWRINNSNAQAWIFVPYPISRPVTGLSLNKNSATLKTTATLQLKATVTPSNATNKKITWTSSDSSIATVDQNGLVKAKKYGKVTITARSVNGKTANCIIQTRFKDVANSGKSYFQPVYWAVDSGITVCTVTFRPEDPVTRGEFVAFLWRLAGKKRSTAKVNFKDVNSGTKFYDAIRWAVGKGIIKGYRDGTFKADNNVTRGETATMIWRYAGKKTPKTKTSPFSDIEASRADSYKAILWGSENGIIKGAGGRFFKNDRCTRGQVVTFLYRYTH